MEERNSKLREQEEEEKCNRQEKFDTNDEQRGESSGFKVHKTETLASVQMSKTGSKETSEFLAGIEVPAENALQSLQCVEELKDEVKVVNKELLKDDNVGQSAEMLVNNQLQESQGQSKLKLSLTSPKQSTSSILPLDIAERDLQIVENMNDSCLMEQDKQNSPDSRHLLAHSAVTMQKKPDGYNWRKYGQKHVKSPEGSRSYYRCTFSGCLAKKIECCDRSNCVIQIVYRNHHNHDPPQKVNCARENKPVLPNLAINGDHDTVLSVRGLGDSIPSTSYKEPVLLSDHILERNPQDSCGSEETVEINLKEYANGPESRRRQKRTTDELGSLSTMGKKSKFVFYAPADVGISDDGYRWRKYGQKMVKGNHHPRNYYRCTSTGCPVRKQVEMSVESENAVVITYKGVHDHDMPVPRKRHEPQSGHVSTAVAPVGMDNLQQISQTTGSADKEGEVTGETLNPDEDKTAESARTLLSIGFEIKHC